MGSEFRTVVTAGARIVATLLLAIFLILVVLPAVLAAQAASTA